MVAPGRKRPRQRRRWPMCCRQALLLLLAKLQWQGARSVLPTGTVVVSSGESTFISLANFGTSLLEKAQVGPPVPLLLPLSSTDGCDSMGLVDSTAADGFVLVVERGNCSFDCKAAAAQEAGASGVIIVNTLEGIYAGREYAEAETDYECGNGQGWLPEVASPVWSDANNVPACSLDDRCASGACLLTEVVDSVQGTKVCCAWDLFVTPGYSDAEVAQSVHIPVAFATMGGGSDLRTWAAGGMEGNEYARPRSNVNISSFLLWALGVATAITAAYCSGDELRALTSQKASPELGRAQDETETGGRGGSELDVGLYHTVGFILLASCALLLLFFFDLTLIITLLYTASASGAVVTVLLVPLLSRVMDPTRTDSIHNRVCPLPRVKLVAYVLAGALALWWFSVRNTASYAWLLQDFFGCCLCVFFLKMICINNVKVASALLSMAFVYDIFWVFISPFLFSTSVMVEVASGTRPTKDPTYCEKYPSDGGCVSSSLPMLLTLPRIGDYMGGYTMLGLGDIVLPGLLLSFALRYDTSVRLPLHHGYFAPTAVGYAVGLMAADVAVYVMDMGQPALLYLVPSTLGVFLLMAHMDGTLPLMWEGPPSLNGGPWDFSARSTCPEEEPLVVGRILRGAQQSGARRTANPRPEGDGVLLL